MAARTPSEQTSYHDDEEPLNLPTATVRQRKVMGGVLLLATLLAFLALISYDWRDISWLANPASPDTQGLPTNFIGNLGAWMTFFGYGIAGMAYRYFAIPLLGILSCFLLHGRVRFFRLRILWMTLLYITLACIFQAYGGSDGSGIPLLGELNLRPNAGGAIGQWLVSSLLAPLLGTVGLHLILWPLAIFFLILLVGVRNTICLIARLSTPRTPRMMEDSNDEESPRSLFAGRNNANTVNNAPANEGLFTRIFRKRIEEAVKDEPDIRTLLRGKRQPQPSADDWRVPTEAPADEPLFRPQPSVRPARGRAPAPVAEPVPQPKPAPVAEPLVLTSDDAPILKPVSPLHSATEPLPAVNDNTAPEKPVFDEYVLPTSEILDVVPAKLKGEDNVQQAIDAIESVFEQFKIDAKVTGYISGPVLTQFEVTPGFGVKLERFKSYERNFLLALRAESIRIQAPIPGRDVVGIEVPNAIRQSVTLREILEGEVWKEAEKKMALPLALGKLATGGDLVVDLAEMPHLLVAGGTGSGKSVAVNDMLVGLLMCRKPEQLRFLMIDPKRVEFTAYDNLPHLLNPVVVEPKKAIFSLRWAVVEMNHRYKLFQRYEVRKISAYNERVDHPDPNKDNPTDKLPYIVLVIDELAELMLTEKADIEAPITSLTQKARAAGIHVIIATQRPTTDIITGTIKANIPGRIALRVAQSNDSRTILDETGAENLIGKGDMLLSNAGRSTQRSQAAWVSDNEINRVCEFIKEQAGPSFNTVLSDTMGKIKEEKDPTDVNALINDFVPQPTESAADVNLGPEDDKSDEGYYKRALELIRQTGRCSTSALQRRLGIGYAKAGRITDMLEERGIIGPAVKAGASREILVDLNAMAREEVAGTDAEDAIIDTRTQVADSDEEPSVDDYLYEATNDVEPVADDDFDLGDLDPSELDGADIIHPSKP